MDGGFMDKRNIGREKEELAARFLQSQGVKIMERNFSCRLGEVDLIGWDSDYLVFFEVKYRKDTKAGYPQEAVSKYKKRKISLVSGYYRMLKNYGDNIPVRFDVVSILGNRIRWDKDAFCDYGL